MARREATPIVLSAEERGTLEAWARATSIERRRVERARIVLLAADGLASRAIARELGCGDPRFVEKLRDVVGLYVDPPEHALVLAVDENPAIQALERAEGYLKLPNGRALTGFAHDYRRRGTTTLCFFR